MNFTDAIKNKIKKVWTPVKSNLIVELCILKKLWKSLEM